MWPRQDLKTNRNTLCLPYLREGDFNMETYNYVVWISYCAGMSVRVNFLLFINESIKRYRHYNAIKYKNME